MFVAMILSFLSIQPEAALAARVCMNPAGPISEANSCADNLVFADAAVECLERLEGQIKAQTGALGAGLDALGSKAVGSQAGKQKNSVLDYKLSAASLDILIGMAKDAQKETAVYLDSVVWPEDSDNPEITGPDFEAFLNSDPCYKDNKDVIARVMNDFDVYIAELEEARDVSNQLEAASHRHENSLDSLGKGAVSSKPKSSSPVRRTAGFKKKKQSKPGSTITGVKEDAAKRTRK